MSGKEILKSRNEILSPGNRIYMFIRLSLILFFAVITASSQVPSIGPGVSHDLAIWRAAHYSDVRYKLNLTLEKMSPVLKGTIEIRVKVSEPPASAGGQSRSPEVTPIVLDWRRIAGHEQQSTISNVFLNGKAVSVSTNWPPANAGGSDFSEHLIFRDGVVPGENIIKLDFTSPILTSGSAITRYVDKEDGAEYIYSLFVPSDASTAFPVFDQPDLKARFSLTISEPIDWQKDLKPQLDWKFISNTAGKEWVENFNGSFGRKEYYTCEFDETKPISTYVFAFAAGPFQEFTDAGGQGGNLSGSEGAQRGTPSDSRTLPTGRVSASVADLSSHIYVRKSQAAKFQPHAAEVFRLTREGIKYLETYFDYKFPFPKYDIVLIPEFPFGGMEHAGATFLRESSVIFPQEPTKGDYISRANLIFHETAHQWFGDTVTMKWFDDLWLKEGFAEFMAYKTLEHVMPDANAWKVFYERNKQAAYATDSTKGTTPIYQKIDNLSAAKSAYGNIVYRKAPSFLRQAEFYLGPDKFQTAVRAFLKKHEYANAGWEDLVKEFEAASGQDLKDWANTWVKKPGLPLIRSLRLGSKQNETLTVMPISRTDQTTIWKQKVRMNFGDVGGMTGSVWEGELNGSKPFEISGIAYVFPNYQDYGYGIFLLDDKSRDYVLKNIRNEKDPFLRSMMYGSLWDSVREGELDPKEYVELVVKNLGGTELRLQPRENITPKGVTLNAETDETIVSSILGRASTAMNYYLSEPPAVAGGLTRSTADAAKPKTVSVRPGLNNNKLQPPATAGGSDLRTRLEDVLIERMRQAPTLGQRITFYRAFLNIAASGNARNVLKQMLKSVPPAVAGGVSAPATKAPPATAGGTDMSGAIPLRTKDRFDIVTRLIVLGDPEAERLLAELEKTETSDDAKRYAYAAHAAFATKEN